MTLLQLDNLTYRFKNTAEAVLYRLNYHFEPGTFYSIIGQSGSGKSTLLSLMAGLDSPVEGAVLYEGEDIREKGYSYHRKHHVSLVFQQYNLIDYLSPLENIRLVSPKAQKETLLELGLDQSQIKRNVLQLSGGQQQRVAIARSLVSEAPVILADEPTGNLDPKTAEEIVHLLKNLAHQSGKCVIVVTHSQEVAQASDVILELKDKKIRELTPNLETNDTP
ncbi:ABC transporter ATP-binding protein [Streptococcus sp. DD13]|uniref:ABC transporter ATP-binding protein n=1 Tax=Streptococcus sp. DD13 TaxID=1777881 RepID=UPI0007921B49|nr:ABC transporter ATP-binding protein [Streptococcus sp. DD13]KXT79084.1 ABC transporter, ATP-binding protein Vex2 [Streptococcus sp. DD13]